MNARKMSAAERDAGNKSPPQTSVSVLNPLGSRDGVECSVTGVRLEGGHHLNGRRGFGRPWPDVSRSVRESSGKIRQNPSHARFTRGAGRGAAGQGRSTTRKRKGGAANGTRGPGHRVTMGVAFFDRLQPLLPTVFTNPGIVSGPIASCFAQHYPQPLMTAPAV
uniref:Uncharacterized protein n=1 Tax=Eutreptiella gymnastica TaxID=73025 RepID=A0A7S4CD87_9EUGL